MSKTESAIGGCLQRLVRRTPPANPSDNEDVAVLKAALNRAGYDATDADIEWAWEQHSDDWAASWLCIASESSDAAVKYLLVYLIAPSSPNDPAQRPGRQPKS